MPRWLRSSRRLRCCWRRLGSMRWWRIRWDKRTKEIGVRMAIGAGIGDIQRMVFREGMTPVAAGLVLGLGASLGVNRVLQSQLVACHRTIGHVGVCHGGFDWSCAVRMRGSRAEGDAGGPDDRPAAGLASSSWRLSCGPTRFLRSGHFLLGRRAERLAFAHGSIGSGGRRGGCQELRGRPRRLATVPATRSSVKVASMMRSRSSRSWAIIFNTSMVEPVYRTRTAFPRDTRILKT